MKTNMSFKDSDSLPEFNLAYDEMDVKFEIPESKNDKGEL
jgi:hypothetical protein